MTPASEALLRSFQRRALTMTPLMAASILAAYSAVREQLTDAELDRVVALGFLDQLVAQTLLDVAFAPVREYMRRSVVQSFRYTARTIPVPPGRSLGIAFDVLNPKVVDAIRALETQVITGMQSDIRETVRAYAENALRDGVNPRAWKTQIRPLIGLGPTQLQEVANYRDALLGRNGRTLSSYALRDQRYDRLALSGEITPAQVERAVARYQQRRISLNAATIARSATLDALKLGQRLAWQQAVNDGITDGGRLKHQWIGTDDDRERPAHVAMNDQVQPWDQPYSNGQLVPGAGDYGCRCIERFFLARTA